MRFISTLSARFGAMLDRHIDRAVARVIERDKSMLAEQVAESYRHMIETGCDPASVAEHISLDSLASNVDMHDLAHYIDLDDVAERVAEKVDVDTAEIASNVARNLDMDDVVSHVKDEIDMAQVCEQCAEKIEVDEDDVIARAAEMVADNIDSDDVAAKVAENIDWEADVLDYDQLARAILRTIAKTAML